MRIPIAIVVSLALAACAAPRSNWTPERLALALPAHKAVLLGEVHDNADGHRLRLEALARAVEAGWRPAIALEQFDRERQADLDAALKTCGEDADCVIRAGLGGGGTEPSGWNWDFYRPVVALALRYDLRILAANLSRADALRVMREGFAPVLGMGLAARLAAVPQDLAAGQRREVEIGHCGKLPASVVPRMVDAQVARDAFMAEVVDANAARGVVLLAGNGHVRRDLGVPRWLRTPALVVGYVEDKPAAGVYDVAVRIKAQPRGDPCAGL
ncbi:ChaN family lipoprotein [Crenobacter cavernae]|uniref:Haem-binding uptake Tiki superfamily ChaN domain-containing protein n=1 Tax=Crenobacter cavernae TaxID=2290923 RepID=A0ABY0FE87_9NEIS|nr:ChaN family lipoprotein [Crenobacter cavernae]RXZ44546.1 hypothetical protein EBB06_05460 [Crenobacter cavernae]